jgi:hypothetical protein
MLFLRLFIINPAVPNNIYDSIDVEGADRKRIATFDKIGHLIFGFHAKYENRKFSS